MSSNALLRQIASLTEGQVCFLTLTQKSGKRFRCECKFIEASELSFSVSLIESNDIGEWNDTTNCFFSTAPVLGQATVSCEAHITKILANTIELLAVAHFDPASLRNYFRVNLRLPITVQDAISHETGKAAKRSTTGQTVDISRSGALTILQEDLKHVNNLFVSIDFPHPASTVKLNARVIRTKRLTKSRWLTAIHFDESDSKQCDIITANCLHEERRQIRENVGID